MAGAALKDLFTVVASDADEDLARLGIEQLTQRFRRLNTDYAAVGHKSLDLAFSIGITLERVRATVGKGKWLGWCDNEQLEARTAQRYIKFREKVGARDNLSHLPSDCSMRGAMAFLAEEKLPGPLIERQLFPVATPEDVVLELLDAAYPFPRRTMAAIQRTHGVDLLVTSWPYCLGQTDAGYVDFSNYDDWLDAAAAWTYQLYEVLEPNGRAVVNLPIDVRKDQPAPRPIGFDGLRILRNRFKYAATIVWSKSPNGQTSKQGKRGSVLSPNAPAVLTGDELLLVVHKGSWNLGRPGEACDLADLSWTNAHWTISGASSKEYPHKMAPEVAERCIKLFSFPGALVGDFHVGEGTTAVAALKLGRKFVGGDLNPTAVALASRNVKSAFDAQTAASR